MKKINKKAFTLIELLAVIVILAIIALIAVPVIMNIINKANKSAFKDSAYGILSAGELYFAERQLDVNGMLKDEIFDLSETTELQLKGEIPEGEILITRDGKIAIAVLNGRYCVTKGINDTDVTLVEDFEKCELPKTIYNNGILSSENKCIINGKCDSGTSVNVLVNEEENYNFYVVEDDGTKLKLIMDSNLGDNVTWYDISVDNRYGPTTAVEALKERTSGWTNIPETEYIYSDDGGENKYTSFTETMRARMLTYIEATTILGCTINYASCPSWLYINLKNTGSNTDNLGNNKHGYWTSAAYNGSDYLSWNVDYRGIINNSSTRNVEYGLRPVIEIKK